MSTAATATVTTTAAFAVPPKSPKLSEIDTALSAKPSSALSLSEQLKVSNNPLPSTRPLIIGHRGCLHDELENTRSGFTKCVDSGCDGVEMDVFRLEKDGTLIVFHGGGSDENPGDLEDYCNQEGSVLDLTYEQCRNLKFNQDFAEFACPNSKTRQGYIPTLEQVLLDLKPYRCQIKLELKDPGTPKPCLELVQKLDMLDQVSFSSFDHENLRVLHSINSDLRLGALFNDVPDDFLGRATQCGATQIHLRYDTCSKDRVDAIHRLGLRSMAWMRGPIGMSHDISRFPDLENEMDCYRLLACTGVQEICCNRPIEAMMLAEEWFPTVQEQ